MRLTERLAEIDRELASFGKTDDELEDVVQRARADAPGSLDAVDAILETLGEAGERSAPAGSTHAQVETVAPPGARPATWDRPERTDPPPDDASGLVDVPEELIRREELPPVLELDGASALEGAALDGDALDGADLDGAALDASASAPELGARDPEGAPTDTVPPPAAAVEPVESDLLSTLFDDTPALGAPPPETGGLADLFDDPRPEPEPAAHEDLSDLLGADLQDALATPPAAHESARLEGLESEDRTELFTAADALAIRSSLPPRAPGEEPEPEGLDAQLDALVDEPLGAAVDEVEMPSEDFELMIDEDVLVLDGDEPGDELAAMDGGTSPRSHLPPPPPSQLPPPPPPASPASQPPPKGLMSRILNRK